MKGWVEIKIGKEMEREKEYVRKTDRDTHTQTEKQLKTDIETESYREKLTKIKTGLYR